MAARQAKLPSVRVAAQVQRISVGVGLLKCLRAVGEQDRAIIRRHTAPGSREVMGPKFMRIIDAANPERSVAPLKAHIFIEQEAQARLLEGRNHAQKIVISRDGEWIRTEVRNQADHELQGKVVRCAEFVVIIAGEYHQVAVNPGEPVDDDRNECRVGIAMQIAELQKPEAVEGRRQIRQDHRIFHHPNVEKLAPGASCEAHHRQSEPHQLIHRNQPAESRARFSGKNSRFDSEAFPHDCQTKPVRDVIGNGGRWHGQHCSRPDRTIQNGRHRVPRVPTGTGKLQSKFSLPSCADLMVVSRISPSSLARLALVLALAVLAGCAAPQKLIIDPNRPAALFQSEPVSVLEGKASYYWDPQPTASGERFNPNEFTAAHKTLPFQTTVRVVNLKNGKSVLVRINDRGPYIRGRIIDLSRRAAEEIQMTKAGVVSVRVEVLAPIPVVEKPNLRLTPRLKEEARERAARSEVQPRSESPTQSTPPPPDLSRNLRQRRIR